MSLANTGSSAVDDTAASAPVVTTAESVTEVTPVRQRSEEFYDIKSTVFNALIDTIDLTQLAKLDADSAREEIRDIVAEIIQLKNVVMSIAEQEELLEDICNDVLEQFRELAFLITHRVQQKVEPESMLTPILSKIPFLNSGA